MPEALEDFTADFVEVEQRHQDSGESCLVAHFDKEWNLLPGCIKCSRCRRWIAYGKENERCPASAN